MTVMDSSTKDNKTDACRMKKTKGVRLHFTLLGGALAMMLTLWGCASIGSPSGGPRDEDPPRFLKANPAPGSVNVDPSDISIEFNELINVKDAFEKVVLSPPGTSVPRVTTRGRRVIVNITDTLLPNTTYTIDFGDAIEDNNEANKIQSFAYTFSTGPTLDSLRISGMVLGAEDLEPQQGVFVGAYISREDSAFLKIPFHRLSRTDEYGRFVLRGLQDTTYRLFALKDLDNDKHFANPEEDIAWYGEPIRPYAERITAKDTIRDLYTGAVDTVLDRERTRFLPNNILLRMYNTRVRPQYLVSYTRPDSTRLQFILNAASKITPTISFVGEDDFAAPLTPERSAGNDTLTFWLPKSLAARDTLQVALRYQRIDVATGMESMANDTLKLLKPKDMSKGKGDKKKKKNRKKPETPAVPTDSISAEGIPQTDSDSKTDEDAETPPPPPTFSFTVTASQTDVDAPMRIEAPVPLEYLDTLAFRLEQNPDSVWSPVRNAYRLQRADSLSERRFVIDYPWERGMTYRLSVDSLAARDIYGVESAKLEYELKMKPAEDLSNLRLTLTGLDPDVPAFAQLIASGDNPKYTVKVKNGIADFQGIESGKYYARIYEDFNGDGVYTPGVYRMQRVFGVPVMDTDSLATLSGDTLNPIAETVVVPLDSIGVIPDSVAALVPDSIDVSVKVVEKELPVLTNDDAMERLRRLGYSLSPLETDSVGTDILIAIQPDLVYYMPKVINVKKNWDVEQSWNVFETALDLQKPTKLKKNKPKRTGNRQQERDEEEDEEDDDFGGNPFDPNRRRNGNNSNGFGNTGFQQNRGY